MGQTQIHRKKILPTLTTINQTHSQAKEHGEREEPEVTIREATPQTQLAQLKRTTRKKFKRLYKCSRKKVELKKYFDVFRKKLIIYIIKKLKNAEDVLVIIQ